MTSKIFIKIGQIYSKVLEGIAAVIILLVALSMLEMAFSRTIFNAPWSALDRINTIAIIWACFLIAGLMVQRDEHIAVTFLITKLKDLKLSILKLVIHIVVLIAFCFLTYYGYLAYELIRDTNVFYPAEIDIPQWLTIFPIFLGSVLGIPFVIYSVVVDAISIHNFRTKNTVKGDSA
jgi:TRAP-type C4-dicarboxylate transport system permease small subunit